jgi:hypothetical protein
MDATNERFQHTHKPATGTIIPQPSRSVHHEHGGDLLR